ncbi:RHS repeat-associated core domain-containing protein [Reinekea marina]|uniref:RHS repeat-associated core domain-containing protein n=1 Tax=Reinekea marina TaxID=1310421 RepID=A0ABV7WUF0_9GAMM|nr:RHS repeat-associated core domain-containing protein [Reinekea marina]MDN3649149.1 RHS repeat-associated core domain-containing protein [Reinekea marina]
MLTSLFDGRQELAQYATSAINQADYQAYRQLTYLPNQVAGLYGQLLAQNLYQAGNKETKVSGHLKGLQEKLYFHSDYQNSTLRVSGVDSQNNYGFRYNAFGVVSSQYQNDDDDWDDDKNEGYSANSIHTRTNNLIPYQYTGKYRESISGFNHMDARWYNPKVGRFIQPDQYNHVNLMLPKGAQSELMRYIGRTQSDLLKDPSQQMRYGYVSGNALRWVDPLGLCDTGISQDQWLAMQSDANAQSQYVQGWVSSMQETGAINSADELTYWAEQTSTAPSPEMAAPVTGSVLAEKLVYSDDAWETLVIGAAAGGRRVPVNSHLSANPTTRMTARQNLAKLGEGRGNEIVRQSVTKNGKSYQTYTKTNPKTGEVYTGRTSGAGTPEQNLARRDANHHINEKGFGPAVLDQSSTNRHAVRGREQQLIQANGGAQSMGGSSGNAINGVSPLNPKGPKYRLEAYREFGE